MGGDLCPSGEPGKQKPRSRRVQELARSRAQENAWQKVTPRELNTNESKGLGQPGGNVGKCGINHVLNGSTISHNVAGVP
jgi:hypothetical protein